MNPRIEHTISAIQELEVAMQQIGTEVYSHSDARAGESGNHHEGTVEGEYREI